MGVDMVVVAVVVVIWAIGVCGWRERVWRREVGDIGFLCGVDIGVVGGVSAAVIEDRR